MLLNRAIELVSYGPLPALACPRCDGQNLHHCGITAFERSEDAPSLVRINVAGPTVKTEVVPSEGSGNPSSRRDAVVIHFSCEQCGGMESDDRIELVISQHKGFTEIGWQFTPYANTKKTVQADSAGLLRV